MELLVNVIGFGAHYLLQELHTYSIDILCLGSCKISEDGKVMALVNSMKMGMSWPL